MEKNRPCGQGFERYAQRTPRFFPRLTLDASVAWPVRRYSVFSKWVIFWRILMSTIDLEVEGMSCGSCVKHVTQALQPLSGVSAVAVDLQSGRVRVNGEFPQGSAALVAALTAAGYPAKLATSASSVPQPKAGGCCGGGSSGGKGGCCS
jgi:copper chaperone